MERGLRVSTLTCFQPAVTELRPAAAAGVHDNQLGVCVCASVRRLWQAMV